MTRFEIKNEPMPTLVEIAQAMLATATKRGERAEVKVMAVGYVRCAAPTLVTSKPRSTVTSKR